MQPDHVRIFDTTLRDGEQSPGATMTSSEKLEVAKTLSRLGVDIIEAGFAAASPDDLRAVKTIAEAVGVTGVEGRASSEPPMICSLARAHKPDIEKAAEAVAPAKHGRIHTFLATSPIHREHKLRMSRDQVLAKIGEMVAYARSFCDDVEFSPEDAGRTEMDFLYEALQAAIEAGARTLNIPDTVGYTIPEEFGGRIALLRENVPGIEKAVISVHCHNDLGLAVANSLSAVQHGARQVEVAINGIGERAGNASLEEVVMALHVRRDLYSIETKVDTTQLTRASRLVSKVTGMMVQPNKAIVGANAFAHEAGIHQDGMLKHEETYEIMRPETVGAGQTQLVLGKHSGRHAFANRLVELGYPISGDGLDKAFARFKKLADKKKLITDADLLALVSDELYQPEEFWRLDAIQVGCGTGMPTATVRLTGPDGVSHTAAEVGTGPVDAVYKAIQSLVHVPATLIEYTVQSVTEGIDALGEVSVRVAPDEQSDAEPDKINPQYAHTRARVFHGHGAHTDVIVASAKAYLAAINRILAIREAKQPESKAAGSAA
ncbi:MAG: 2-isopropylmalate synthase [Deltaproteobacteria bacterium]|nr:2-isopropylmalate synthase [Deltaproteobacteria bacterium]NND29310.1 2-isopropylmalate synthase [Myxococcales bacterium]MBT8463630.1 2-isopropylmalate synthase [Deltaproteobacteria bacterium]MBT8481411.1 2-isopropylmalate synthase [Deltaproteobacteria bacterium]NNK06881.1 2-isopropylmalate synthase [Myxococcales bacterium]